MRAPCGPLVDRPSVVGYRNSTPRTYGREEMHNCCQCVGGASARLSMASLLSQCQRDQIRQRALCALPVVFVGVDQERADRGVPAVCLHLVQADPGLAGRAFETADRPDRPGRPNSVAARSRRLRATGRVPFPPGLSPRSTSCPAQGRSFRSSSRTTPRREGPYRRNVRMIA